MTYGKIFSLKHLPLKDAQLDFWEGREDKGRKRRYQMHCRNHCRNFRFCRKKTKKTTQTAQCLFISGTPYGLHSELQYV